MDIKSTAYYFLHCPMYITERRTVLSTIENIENNLLDLPEPTLIKALFDSNLFATTEYFLSTKRFEELLFQ